MEMVGSDVVVVGMTVVVVGVTVEGIHEGWIEGTLVGITVG